MADTMQFDLVSPERRLVSGQAVSVRIPGTEGDLTAMPGHAPVVTTLRPGILVVEMDSGSEEYAVTGGFAQVTGGEAKVLADEAMPKSEVTSDFLNDAIAKARAAQQAAEGSAADKIAKFLGDLVALGDHIGLAVESGGPAGH